MTRARCCNRTGWIQDEDSPFDQFSRQFGFRGPGGMNGMPRQRHQMITGEGSGFFISADGYAVTNNHVVDHAKSVQVTTDDGTIYTAKVVGTDPKTDLALIKVDGKKDFPFVKFADQTPRDRRLGGRGRQSVRPRRHRHRRHRLGAAAATSAPVPMTTTSRSTRRSTRAIPAARPSTCNGNVIGVNTAIFSPSGGSVGIGFDIPADDREDWSSRSSRTRAHVTRGWLGVQIQPVTAGDRRQPRPEGGARRARRRAAGRQPGGQGRHQGRRRHHRRQRHRGEGLPAIWPARIATLAPGTSVKLDILRKGDEQDGDARPSASCRTSSRPRPTTARRSRPPACRISASAWRRPATSPGAGGKGVVVTEVDPNGTGRASAASRPATSSSMSAARRSPMSATCAPTLAQAKSSGKNSVLMQVKSADATRFVAVPLA